MIWEVDGDPVHASTGGVDEENLDWTERPALVLVHGAGMDATAWHLQTRYLAHRGVRAMAIDLPAHGLSKGEPLSSIPDLARWLARAIRSLPDPPTQVVVAGHSMGTYIALQMAADEPHLVRRLLLVATAESMAVHRDLLDGAQSDLAAAGALMANWGHGRQAQLGPNPNPGMWMSGSARALVERSQPGALLADFTACRSVGDVSAIAGRVQCPSALVLGTEDKMTPARSGQALAASLNGGAEVTILDRVGHMVMTEAPETVRLLLLDHTLNRV